MNTVTYHGWIICHKNQGFNDSYTVEYEEEGRRVSQNFGYNPGEAIEWWEKKLGQPIKLLDTPLGAYRVYVETE